MSHNMTPELPDDLNQFAQRLAAFKACSVIIDRDRMLFQAGRAAAQAEFLSNEPNRRTSRAWQSALAMLLAFTLGIGTSFTWHSEKVSSFVFSAKDQVHPDQVTKVIRATDTHSANESDSIALRPAREERGDVSVPNAVTILPSSSSDGGLQTRLALIEQMAEGIPNLGSGQTKPKAALEFAERSHPDPVLSYRSLLRSDGAQTLINQLIKESSL